MEEITDKIVCNVSYVIPGPGGFTGMNPANFSAFNDIRMNLEELKVDLDDMMSTNTKLV